MTAKAHRLTALCVFCGSQPGDNPLFAAGAARLGVLLAENGTTLVYGGGRTGLMGAIADGALANGGTILGVIPEFLKGWELAHARATEMVVVPDMHTRKRTMFERADAFCLLPGGIGSLDEFFEIVTWRQLHRHNKPVVVLNLNGYWQPLVALFRAIVANGFAHAGHQDLVTVVESAEAVIGAVERELAAPKTPLAFAADNPFAPRP